jgi:hypothetical protein
MISHSEGECRYSETSGKFKKLIGRSKNEAIRTYPEHLTAMESTDDPSGSNQTINTTDKLHFTYKKSGRDLGSNDKVKANHFAARLENLFKPKFLNGMKSSKQKGTEIWKNRCK